MSRKHPSKNWTIALSRGFSKEEIQMAEKDFKKCTMVLTIREMQIKSTLSRCVGGTHTCEAEAGGPL